MFLFLLCSCKRSEPVREIQQNPVHKIFSGIEAEPNEILYYPQESWRNEDYEMFRWKDFPSIVIFDTASYNVQNALFKRIAFFVEKAEFRDTLAQDREIADLHGWNAHDYRASDLSRFFDTAAQSSFPLNSYEETLKYMLIDSGVIVPVGSGFVAGTGAILSISRESPEYVRARLMIHECFHGLFFIDAEFRTFSRSRFERLDPVAKRFLIAYFEYQQYNIDDGYLVVNEFMAYVLQQPVDLAAAYFGKNLPAQLAANARFNRILPRYDPETNTWSDLAHTFSVEAEAFSAYVHQRWGLRAGAVSQKIR
ncbi:hypothetical protein FACS1894172_01620 [Spirochaetia bacterium]|nr:hypothetical protein FACS1894172_01620 [Spirochaetia bacterium]